MKNANELWALGGCVKLLHCRSERSNNAKKRGISLIRVPNLTDWALIPGKENLNLLYEILEFTCPVNLPQGMTLQGKAFHPHFSAVVHSIFSLRSILEWKGKKVSSLTNDRLQHKIISFQSILFHHLWLSCTYWLLQGTITTGGLDDGFLFPDQYESSDIVELNAVCSSSIFSVLPHHFFSLFLIYVSRKGIIFSYYFSLETYFWDFHFH